MPETTVRPATARSPMDALRVHQAAFDSTRFRILSQEEVDHMEQRCNYLRARKRILANLERLQSAYDRGVQLLPPMTRSPPPAPAPGASLARSELDSLTEELHNLEKTLIGHMAAVLGTYALEESLRSLWPSESDVNEST